MLINDIGEFELIEVLSNILTSAHTQSAEFNISSLKVPNGDDAAAWITNGKTELFTMDTCVENVHFNTKFSSWHDIGWKALASNISDILAMGGIPAYGLVTIGAPTTTKIEDLKSLYQGFANISEQYDMIIVGGDLVKSETMFISVSLIGVTDNEPITRSGATSGDLVILTDTVGSSRGGLLLLSNESVTESETQTLLLSKHRKPVPSIPESILLSNLPATSSMDLSDGLVSDLEKLCKKSNCGAIINASKVPVDQELIDCFPDQYINIALAGGEDYVLLATIRPTDLQKLQTQTEKCFVIGEITSGPDIKILTDSGVELDKSKFQGWDHFSE